MKNLIVALVMLTIGSAVAKEAQKDSVKSADHYVCLNTTAAGLNWTNGKWTPSTFTPLGEFQLEVEIDEVWIGGTKMQFVHYTTNSDSGKMHCGMELVIGLLDSPHCFGSGETITFSPEQLRGGISRLLGSMGTGSERDSLVVLPFTCQKR